MTLTSLMSLVATTFDRAGIPYLIVGSAASGALGEPRYTNDLDVVADLSFPQIAKLSAAFPSPEFYWSIQAAEEAVRHRFQFNVLHPSTGLKLDVIVAGLSEFDRSQLSRGIRLSIAPDCEAVFASPEDVILKKLEYFREGGSEKHLRDIVGVLKVQGEKIDHAYLKDWIARLDLADEWKLIEDRMNQKPK